MNEKGVDLDGVLDWLAKYNEVLSKFQAHRLMLPSWGPDMVGHCGITESMKERAKEASVGRMDETDDEDDYCTCFELEIDTKYNSFICNNLCAAYIRTIGILSSLYKSTC